MPLPWRVLVVDDRQHTRQGLRAWLGLLPDVEWVGEASDGQEALELAKERQPDVVLMDVRMVNVDGLEATRRIKSELPHVRVVVLTLYSEYEAEAIAAGADAFLVKGGSFEALRKAICRA